MKILFAINSMSNKAGTERVSAVLANLLYEKLSYDISIFNRDAEHKDVKYHINNNIKVIKQSGNPFVFLFGLQKYILKNKPDYVLIHNMGRLSLLCSLLIKRNTRLYSLEHVASEKKGILARFLDRLFYKRIDKTIVLSDKDLQLYKWNQNVVKINNISPYEICNLDYNTNSRIIIAIGRLTRQKNFLALLEAWRKIYTYMPEWKLEIYGDGEEKEDLQNFIFDKDLKRVELKGVIDDMYSLYRQSSFIVMSSIYEGLPLVLIEAQSFGLPIVSFDCPFGPSEIIEHQKNGILVENQNISKLSESILYLANNHDIRNTMSKNALISAKRFSKETILQEWKNTFN